MPPEKSVGLSRTQSMQALLLSPEAAQRDTNAEYARDNNGLRGVTLLAAKRVSPMRLVKVVARTFARLLVVVLRSESLS